MQAQIVDMLEKDAEFQYMFANAVNSVKGEALEKHGSARLIGFFQNVGGPAMARCLANAFANDNRLVKCASRVHNVPELFVTEFSVSLKPKTAASKIEVVTGVNEWNSATHKDTQRIIRDGFTIRDTRDDSEKSELAKGDYRQTIANPDLPGRYNIIMSGYGDKDVHILKAEGGPKGMLVVVDPETRKYFTAGSTALYTSSQPMEQKNTVWDDAVSLDNMEPFEKYILVNEKFMCSVPFKVKSGMSVDKDLSKLQVKWLDHVDHQGRSTPGGDSQGCVPMCSDSWGDEWLVPVSGGGRMRKVDGSTLIPRDAWKAYKLESKDESEESGAQREARQQLFTPATYGEVLDTMTKAGLHNVMVESKDDGIAYSIHLNDVIDQDNLSYKKAAIRLVRDYGLRLDDVEDMLKEACASFKARRVVKMAQQQVSMPPPPYLPMGTDPTTGVPVDWFKEQLVRGKTIGVPKPMRAGPGSGINFGGEGALQAGQAENSPASGEPPQPDQKAMQLAQDAGQAGQGTVFDQAVIGGMAKTYDVSSVIDGYMPDFMKSLDKLGRVLFMFYWKNDDFAERYGDQDLSQMEDSLRGVFKNYGDLLLDLKQKTIEPDTAVEA